jgi:hypothetical protein
MLDYSLALDLAHAAVRDRLGGAERQAIVHLLPLSARLDRSLECRPVVAGLSSAR